MMTYHLTSKILKEIIAKVSSLTQSQYLGFEVNLFLTGLGWPKATPSNLTFE